MKTWEPTTAFSLTTRRNQHSWQYVQQILTNEPQVFQQLELTSDSFKSNVFASAVETLATSSSSLSSSTQLPRKIELKNRQFLNHSSADLSSHVSKTLLTALQCSVSNGNIEKFKILSRNLFISTQKLWDLAAQTFKTEEPLAASEMLQLIIDKIKTSIVKTNLSESETLQAINKDASDFVIELSKSAIYVRLDALSQLVELATPTTLFQHSYKCCKKFITAREPTTSISAAGMYMLLNLSMNYSEKETFKLLKPVLKNNHTSAVATLRSIDNARVQKYIATSYMKRIRKFLETSEPKIIEIHLLRSLDYKTFQFTKKESAEIYKALQHSVMVDSEAVAEMSEDSKFTFETFIRLLFVRKFELTAEQSENLQKELVIPTLRHEVKMEQLRRQYNIDTLSVYELDSEIKQQIEPLILDGIITSDAELTSYLNIKNNLPLASASRRF